jgi:hypothetical protein
VRSKPSQRGVIGNASRELTEIGHELVDALTLKRRREHLDSLANKLIA